MSVAPAAITTSDDTDLHTLLRQVERRLTQLAQHEGDIALLYRLRCVVPPPVPSRLPGHLTLAKGGHT
jgi:hypothetical protein